MTKKTNNEIVAPMSALDKKKRAPRIKKAEVIVTPAPLPEPVIIVQLKDYQKILWHIKEIVDDMNDVEHTIKSLQYDYRQDLGKLTSAISDNVFRVRKILFPGEVFG